MEKYNKFMTTFWLIAAIAIFVITTIMGFIDGFDVWMYYYIMAGMAFFAYLAKKFVARQIEKQQQKESNK